MPSKKTNTTYILYGAQGSGSAIAEIALRKCGLNYTLVRAATWEPDSALAALQKINPMGQIPTLILPDGSVLTESAAILIQLGLSFPASGLLPDDEVARAQVIRGLVFISANCYSALSISDYPERWTTAKTKPPREAVRQAARQQLHRNWEIFADCFHARPYLCGKAPGALDYMAAIVSKWSGTRSHIEQHRPDFFQLVKRIEAHPDVVVVHAAHWPES